MKKNKLLIVGNWKMNPNSVKKADEIFIGIKESVKDLKNTKVVICPPFVYLNELEKKINTSKIFLGAQDVFWENSGSFTGEISPEMLKEESYVILGHSERRSLGETDSMISKKIISAMKANLSVILCIGEKERDSHGEYLLELKNQIINSIGKLPKTKISKLIIAYEPVWAIGKTDNEAMLPEDIHEMTIFIKKVLTDISSVKTAFSIPILYGGSVTHNNAKEIITLGEVQGLLVGRESLNPKKFGELLKNID
jgi:triosephosphate isomerase (TIM)